MAWSLRCSTRSRWPGPGLVRVSTTPTRTPSNKPFWATRWASTRFGRWSTIFWRNTPTAPTPRCCTATSRRSPRTCGSATACGSCPSPTTTRCARRSRWRCSTSSATGGWSSAPAARRQGPSWRGSTSTPTRPGPSGMRLCATSWAAGPTTSTSLRASTGRCPSAGCSPSPAKIPTRPSGGPPARCRATTRSASGASGCARSPWASRPRIWPSGSRRSARATPTAISRWARSATSGPPPSPWCTATRPTRRPGPPPRSRSCGIRATGAGSSPRWPTTWPTWRWPSWAPTNTPAMRPRAATRAYWARSPWTTSGSRAPR